MEAVGRLAGGIAHGLNNWLTVIVGYAEMLLDDTADPAMRDGLHEILSASRASTSITKNLLTFSRKQVIQLQTIDLNQVVSEFHQLVQRIVHRRRPGVRDSRNARARSGQRGVAMSSG